MSNTLAALHGLAGAVKVEIIDRVSPNSDELDLDSIHVMVDILEWYSETATQYLFKLGGYHQVYRYNKSTTLVTLTIPEPWS